MEKRVRPIYKLKRIGFDEHIIINKDRIKIGRNLQNDIVCHSNLVSRNHAVIYILPGDQLCIEDRKSSNHTFLNGCFLPEYQKFPLLNGDVVGFGVSEYESDRNDMYLYELSEIEPHDFNVVTLRDENNVNENVDHCHPIRRDNEKEASDVDDDCVQLPFQNLNDCAVESRIKADADVDRSILNKNLDNRIEEEVNKKINESLHKLGNKFNTILSSLPKTKVILNNVEGSSLPQKPNNLALEDDDDDIECISETKSNAPDNKVGSETDRNNKKSLFHISDVLEKVGKDCEKSKIESYCEQLNDNLDEILINLSKSEDVITNDMSVDNVPCKNLLNQKSKKHDSVKLSSIEDTNIVSDLVNKDFVYNNITRDDLVNETSHEIKNSVIDDLVINISDDEDTNFDLIDSKENSTSSENITAREKRKSENCSFINEVSKSKKVKKNDYEKSKNENKNAFLAHDSKISKINMNQYCKEIEIVVDDDCIAECISNKSRECASIEKKVRKSSTVDDKENHDKSNVTSNISELNKKQEKRKSEESSVVSNDLSRSKKYKKGKDHVSKINDKTKKADKYSSLKSSNSDEKIDCGGTLKVTSIKKKKKDHTNRRSPFDDDGDAHFHNSDDELFCSQIFNTTDLEIDEDKEVKIKEEPQEEKECDHTMDDDVIVIDDDEDDKVENDDFTKWYGRLSQSFFESDEEEDEGERLETDKPCEENNVSFGQDVYVENLLNDVGVKSQEKEALDEIIRMKTVKVSLTELDKKIAEEELYARKKKDKKIILTDPLPLLKHRKETSRKVNDKKNKSKANENINKSKSKDVLKRMGTSPIGTTKKQAIKETRKEKLKIIAENNAEVKTNLSSSVTKPSTCVSKVTRQTRSDCFVESFVNDANKAFPSMSLKRNFKIPKKPTKSSSSAEKRSPVRQSQLSKVKSPPKNLTNTSKELCVDDNLNMNPPSDKESSCNLLVTDVCTTAGKRVTFSIEPIIHMIELKEGCKLLPCKKDAPIRKITVDNSINTPMPSMPTYSIDETLYSVLRWKVFWLKNDKASEIPNVSNNRNGPNGLLNIKKEYTQFKQYFCIFQELLLHELWTQMKDEFNLNSRKTNRQQTYQIVSSSKREVEFFFHKVPEAKHFLVIRCLGYLTNEEFRLRRYPKAYECGTVCVQTYNQNKEKKTCYAFCYIEQVDICRIHRQELFQNNFFERRESNKYEWRVNLSLLIKDDGFTIDRNADLQLMVILSMRSYLRLFHSVNTVKDSPLQSLIFNPGSHDYSIGDIPVDVRKQHSFKKLNYAQQEAVISCTKLCLNNKPNMALIHGPPGTGKSHVIISLIEHIYQTSKQKANRLKERPKILLCTPSNLAIDHLVVRLLDLREEMIEANGKMKLSIVRVGQVDQTNQKVLSVSLERLVMSRLTNELCDDVPIELSLINAKINSLKLVREKAGDGSTSAKEVDEKLSDLMKRQLELQTISPGEYNRRRRNFDKNQIKTAEKEILRGCDIICSTLSSSVLDCVLSAFQASDEDVPKLTCCIIDEACQCIEPEALIPLQLNLAKFILVGDHKQLPATVISEVSKSKGLGNSLFFRIFSCWENMAKKPNVPSPIHSLDVQYRMHPSIMNWPAKYFYNNKLKSGYDEKKYHFPLTHYMVLNHGFNEDPANKECNPMEADLVVDLSIAILNSEGCSDLKIGVITPYRQQRSLLLDKLSKKCEHSRVRNRIKVNTVDGYQGAEQDVIIMSCVRSSGIGFLADEQRLNVAVTRAKHSLIICANFENFKSNKHWNSLLENAKERKKYLSIKDTRQGIESILPNIILSKR